MNDDRELEDLLRASMKHHAEQMPEIDSVHTRRRRTPVLIAAAASVVVIAAGAVALTSLAPIFSAGSGPAASASTHLDVGGPRPLFSQEFSAGDGSSAAPTPAAAAEGLAGLVQLSRPMPTEMDSFCSSAAPQHVEATANDVSAIYICHDGSLTQEDGSIWATAVVDQIVGGIDEFLAATALADEPESKSCSLGFNLPAIVTVHTSDAVMNIDPPRDWCRSPLPAWTVAFENLIVQKVREVPIEMTQSSLAIDTGCPDQFKDMMTLEKPAKAKGSPDPLPESPLTMCVYKSGLSDVGTLVAGLGLSTKGAASINGIYPKIESDPECDPTDHHLFVVLTGKMMGWVQIGLDGCGIFGSRGGMWSGSGDLRAYLVWLIQDAGQGKALLNQ